MSIGRQGEGCGLEVTLEATLLGVEHQLAAELVEAAHQVCLYSNATRGNIPVEVIVTDD